MAARVPSVWWVMKAVVMAALLGIDGGLAALVVLGSGSAEIKAGNTAMFVCVAYGNESISITWSSGHISLDNNTMAVYEEELWLGGYRFLRSVLEVCGVEPSMDGTNYTCAAEDDEGTDSAVFTIAVSISEVVMAVDPGDIQEDTGNTLLIPCVAYSDAVRPAITWIRDSDQTTLDNSTSSRITVYEERVTVRGYTFMKSILQLCSIDSTDVSNYTCTADTGFASRNLTFQLTLNIPKVLIAVVSEDIQENTGYTLLIPCVAYSEDPISITWIRDSDQTTLDNSTSSRVTVYEEQVTVKGYTFMKSILQLCSIDSTDVSDYTCTADTGFASNSGTFKLNINDPGVTITVGPEDIVEETGTAVNSTCVAYSEHHPSITWIREPDEVISGNGDRISVHEQLESRDNLTYIRSTLEIRSLEAEDTGIYTCLASNGIERASSTFRITARTECTTILKENCSQLCSKISGVDTCLCHDDYLLTEDNVTCEALPSSEAGISTAVIGGAAAAGLLVIAVVLLSLAVISCIVYRRRSLLKNIEHERFEDTILPLAMAGPADSSTHSDPHGHIPTGEYPVLNPIFDPDDDALLDLRGSEPVYETLDFPSDGGACGKAAGNEGVAKAAPVKQAEEELRSFESEARPRAVENPYDLQ